ncbi:hypothetical protein MFIFM68171_09900 [Madurella fahalii]|uniref:Fungal N-terminal domain-containing protein n=1 Tax=Madurella fahalii TaxID=1157608 RepID=A0ABQ0GPN5_9PEZI
MIMEAAALIGLITACATVAAKTGTLAADLNTLATKLKNAELTVHHFVAQLSSLRSASTRLAAWLSSHGADSLSEAEIADLQRSLDACHALAGLVKAHVDRIKKGQVGSVFGIKAKAKAAWNDEEMKEYRQSLQAQVQALMSSCRFFSSQASLSREEEQQLV